MSPREKIAALERLARDPGASPNEKANALRAAAALRAKLPAAAPPPPPTPSPFDFDWLRPAVSPCPECGVVLMHRVGCSRARQSARARACPICGGFAGHVPMCPRYRQSSRPRAHAPEPASDADECPLCGHVGSHRENCPFA